MPQIVDYNGAHIEFPDGMASGDIEAALKANAMSLPVAKPAVVQAGQAINSIPRQLGLTARYGLEGLANTAQVVTEPLRYLTDRLTGSTGKTVPLGVLATQAADAMGLPAPQNATERVVGDATRLVAGTGVTGGAASLARSAPGLIGQAGTLLSANMPQQLASAAGAGLAGGASREAGGSPLMQAGASLVGGIAGGTGYNGAVKAAGTVTRALTPAATDQQISVALQRSGVDISQLSAAAQNSLRADLAQALSTGQNLDPAAVRRLADFRATGLTPTRGAVTLDPVQVTREMNLAKTGANSRDGTLQGLARVQNDNNARLIANMNDLGAGTNVAPIQAGRVLGGSIQSQADALRSAETAAWNEARTAPGYTQPIAGHVLSDINQRLGDEGLMPFMSRPISDYMAAFQSGQQPFTPQAYRNLQSMLSREMTKGGNEAAAAGAARQVLENSPMTPITNPLGIDTGNMPVTQGLAAQLRAFDAQPGEAIDAVNRARAATRAAYGYEGSSPLVRAALSEGAAADPTRLAERFIINGTPDEAAAVAREVSPAGREVIRNALATHIKKTALSGAEDEVGKVSQSALNSALNKQSDEKLRLFFSPQELAALRANSRVASYVQTQPVGSAVNNSNSGALLLGKGVDALSGLARSIPGVGPLMAAPLLNGLHGLNVAVRTRQAQNVIPGLLTPSPGQPLTPGLLLPGVAAAGGLLAAPTP